MSAERSGDRPVQMPSSEWTPEERVCVVAALAFQLGEEARRHFVSQVSVVDVADRIQFILTRPAGFLELNREAILKGEPHIEEPISYPPVRIS